MFAEEERTRAWQFRWARAPTGSASLSERLRLRLRYGEREQLHTSHPSIVASVNVVSLSLFSLVAAPSIFLQSRPLALPSPPCPLSHHGRPLLVLAHHLLPQVLSTLYRLRNAHANSHLAESWYRLVLQISPQQTRLSLTSAQNMPSTPLIKVSLP